MGNRVEVLFEIDRDSQGRTVLRQIDRDLDKIGKTAQATGHQVDIGLQVFKGQFLFEFFKRGADAALDFGRSAVESFNQAQSAALGLQSVAEFKGISGSNANEAIKNLDIVKNGLLSISDASTALKNLLAAGFGLDQSIELINRFGDSAAFGRQSSLSLGQAVASATEGIKNQNSILVDNAGVTKNLSVILKERGFELQDLSDKVNGAAAREALYQGLLEETQGQVGDASKLTGTYAGQISKLEAAYQQFLVALGKAITDNPKLRKGIDDITGSIIKLIEELADPNSKISRFVQELTSAFGEFLSVVAAAKDIIIDILDLLKGPGFGDPGTSAALIKPDILGGKTPARFLEDGFQRFQQQEAEKAAKQKQARETASPATQQLTKQQQDALQDIRNVGIKGEDNSIAKLYAQNTARIDDFLKKNATVGDEIKLQFIKAANAARDADLAKEFRKIEAEARRLKRTSDELQTSLFAGRLSTALGAGNLLTEKARLEAGLGGAGRREDSASREAEIRRLESEIEQRKSTPEFGPRELQELVDRISQLREGDKIERILREATDRQIQIAQSLLEQATTSGQKGLALDAILSATADISKLTPEQVDVRAKAIDQSLTVQAEIGAEAARQQQDLLAVNREQIDVSRELAKQVPLLTEQIAQLVKNNVVNINITNDSSAAIERLPSNDQ